MITRTFLSYLFTGLALFAAAAGSQAATVSCQGAGYDIRYNLVGAIDCLILSPLDANVNDSVNPPASDYTVNKESFFGKNLWQFDGRFEVSEQTNSSSFFSFLGDGQGGGYVFTGTDYSTQFMFVMKDGAGTNLVAYLLPTPVAASTNIYSTPFISPPFVLTGNSTSKDISHISVYYLSDSGGSGTGVPEPSTIAVLGLGLLGMGLLARHRRNG